MKQTKTGRVLAILILGILFGIYRHFTQMRWLTRGREAFLADQSRQFDRFTRYHSGVQMAIAGVIIASILFGLYELVAVGITKVLPPSMEEE